MVLPLAIPGIAAAAGLLPPCDADTTGSNDPISNNKLKRTFIDVFVNTPLRINISIILILSSLQKLIGQGLSNPIPAKVSLSDNVSR